MNQAQAVMQALRGVQAWAYPEGHMFSHLLWMVEDNRGRWWLSTRIMPSLTGLPAF